MKTPVRYLQQNRMLKHALLGVTAVALTGLAEVGSANDHDLVATTIPASACTPANNVQAGLVYLSNGSWMFTGNATGGVVFYCPLPLNSYTVSDNTNDNDMTHFRVYYRDTDATGSAANVTARLVRRRTDGSTLLGAQFNSDNVNIDVHTAQIQPYLHDLAFSAIYSMQVTMARRNTSENPMFTGIDFPDGSFVP
ncbi:MAG: hypothetical protein ACU84J_10825 [Gammaproteobacteria bacterium]